MVHHKPITYLGQQHKPRRVGLETVHFERMEEQLLSAASNTAAGNSLVRKSRLQGVMGTVVLHHVYPTGNYDLWASPCSAAIPFCTACPGTVSVSSLKYSLNSSSMLSLIHI